MAGGVRRARGGAGKSARPDGGGPANPLTLEGADADAAVADARRRTTARRELVRNPHFEEISPQVGELDETALDRLMADDPDEALGLLADLTGATDPVLRELARRLAGALFLDIGRVPGQVRPRGIGRMQEQPYRPDGGDLDIDASLDALAPAAAGQAVDPQRLRLRGWVRPGTAWCLLVDRSGSMGGKPLASAAVAAAAVAHRGHEDYSVLAFGKDVVVAKSQDVPKAASQVVTDVLSLRGFGTTDLAGALRAAAVQLARSRAGRKIAVVLSDCRATVAGDPVAAAALLSEVLILAPADDCAEAEQLGRAIGARVVTVTGPSQVAEAMMRALSAS